MALHKMQDPKVDLSDVPVEDEPKGAVLDLSEDVGEIAPVAKEIPLDLRRADEPDEVFSYAEERVISLDKDRSEHRREFEERIKRLEKTDRENKAAELGFRAGPAKAEKAKETPLVKELEKSEDALRHRIDELKLKLAIVKKDEAVKKQIAAEDKIESKEVQSKTMIEKTTMPDKELLFYKPGQEQAKEPERKPTKTLKFPDGFLWGTATSAYQVEGGIRNNWSQWEKLHVMGKQFMKSGGKKKDFICDQAADSYNRWEEDLKLAKKLNNNAIRFSLEWARLQPDRQTWDVTAVEHYREMLKTAKKMGFTTVVTLWHWTVPTWFATLDGWEKSENIKDFLAYVDLVIKEFGSLIDCWVTLNEPMVPVTMGYIIGSHPPAKRYSIFKARKALGNMISAHRQAYKLIKNHFDKAEIGISILANYIEAAGKWTGIDPIFARFYRYFAHDYFLKKIKDTVTYIGIDYYRRMRVTALPPFFVEPKRNKTDMNWEHYPEGLYQVLKRFDRYDKPIYITENGIADSEDTKRPEFIKQHLKYLKQAIDEGIEVRGYFHWSLLDNFEWQAGYAPKFGLYAVDRETFERTPRPSAALYREICAANAVKLEE